jgi:hypothetical protein
MALQICQWDINYNVSSVSGNNAVSILPQNQSLILPTDQNVLVKKICLDCIYNNPGNDIIKFYSLAFALANKDNVFINNENYNILNAFNVGSNTRPFIELNKNNPIKNLNMKIGGLRLVNNFFDTGSLIFNQTGNPLTSVSFLLSVYYVS